MRQSIYSLVIVVSSLFITGVALGQGASYNTTGAPADASAMLDIASTTKGLLAPRMTAIQKAAIASPATGLLVYQTDSIPGFYYYSGIAWVTMKGTGLVSGSARGEMLYWDSTAWARVPAGSNGQVLSITDGMPVWVDINPNTLQLPIISWPATGITSVAAGGTVTIGNDGSVGKSLYCGAILTTADPAIYPFLVGTSILVGNGSVDAYITPLPYTLTWSSAGWIGDLIPGTKYYVRGFSQDSLANYHYGNIISFTTSIALSIPTLSIYLYGYISIYALDSVSVQGEILSTGGSPITVSGICWDTHPMPTVALSTKTTTGPLTIGGVTGIITTAAPSTTYYTRCYATNALGTAYGNQDTFRLPTMPGVTTGALSSITVSSANLGVNVTSIGGYYYTGMGLCWSTSPGPTLADPHNSGLLASVGSFTLTATGLLPGTTYYVRPYVTNPAGTAYGTVQSFTTLALPTVTTAPLTGFTLTSAAGGGSVSGGTAPVTARGVCWSTTTAPTAALSTKTIDGSGPGSFTSSITGLTSGATYYIRAYATSSVGTGYGAQISFSAALPVVLTTSATGVWYDTAITGGNVISGSVVTARGVCYDYASTLPGISGPHTVNGAGTGIFTTILTGLSMGYTYYIRAYATNSAGTAYGPVLTFRTLFLPTVELNSLTYSGGVRALATGNVTNAGITAITERGMFILNSPIDPLLPSSFGSYIPAGSGLGSYIDSFGTYIGSILGDSTYVRAYAKNTSGTSFSSTQLVVRNGTLPTVGINPGGATTPSTIASGGIVSSAGSSPVTARGVCWSTYPMPVVYPGGCTVDGSGTGSFTSNITGLLPATLYYLRAYATNAISDAYSSQTTITTLLGPIVAITMPSGISYTTVTSGGYVSTPGATSRGVCWRPSASGTPTIADPHTVDGSGSGSFTSNVTGLTPGVTYYIVAYAIDGTGTGYSTPSVFTTLTSLPVVTTSAVSGLTPTSATCGGNVTSAGTSAVTARGVCWSSTTTAPTIASSPFTVDGSGTGIFTSSITGLTPGITYYVSAYATSSLGTYYDAGLNFTQAGLAVVTNSFPGSITSASADCAGSVSGTWASSVTARGICWGTSPGPGLAGSHTVNGSGSGSFTGSMSGLAPYTVYYVRAYATNAVGTVFGTEYAFLSIDEGASYGGGFFIKMFTPGDPGFNAVVPHGLILGPSDISSGASWSNGSYILCGTSSVFGAGLSNTLAIIAAQGSSGGYAANLCHASSLGGYSDWYLPTRADFAEVTGLLGRMGHPAGGLGGMEIPSSNIWTSTEVGSADASTVFMVSADHKTTLNRVRAGRTF